MDIRLAFLLLGLCACQSGGDRPSALPAGPRTSLDVHAVVSQVRLAFRPDGAGFSAGHESHRVAVDGEGAVSFTALGDGEATLQLRLAELRRGDGFEQAVGPARVHVDREDVHTAVVARPGVVETLRHTADGVEQAWSFSRAPAGEGDLHLRLTTSGLPWVAQTAGGHHFGTRGAGPLVRYGHADWIAADGARTRLSTRRVAAGLQIEVPAALVERGPYPAQIDPLIGPEVGLDTGVVVPPASNQEQVAVASDGTSYLVVWRDFRTRTGADLWGARVDQNGALLDPTGFVISDFTGGQYAARATFGAGQYFVVWADTRPVAPDIYGARVTTAGVVLDPTGIPIGVATGMQVNPAVAFDGTNYFVAWEDLRASPTAIWGARVKTDGTVLDAAGIKLSNGANGQYDPAVARGGVGVLVVWDDMRVVADDIYGTFVSTAGVVQQVNGFLISGAAGVQDQPAIDYDGTTYNFVVWRDSRSGIDVYGARVSASAVVQEAGGIAISTAAGGQMWPRVTFANGEHFVVWEDQRSGISDVYAARVSAAGTLLDSSGVAISTAAAAQSAPDLAATSSGQVLVAWADGRNGNNDAVAARVDLTAASPTVLDANGLFVCRATNSEVTPAVASDGTDFLVVWEDGRSGLGDIRGTRVSATGKVLDPSGILVCSDAAAQTTPAVAWDGTSYLVVWADARNSATTGTDIWGARVSAATGAVLDPGGLVISSAANNQSQPAVASDGTGFLVVFADARNGASNLDIYGARVSEAPAVLDPSGFPISTAANNQSAPRLAFANGEYLVAWADARAGNSDVYAARVTPSGSVSDPTGIAISTGAASEDAPAVAAAASEFLVAWVDARSGNADVFAARVVPAGTVIDSGGLAVATGASKQQAPTVGWDPVAAQFLVAWDDDASSLTREVHVSTVSESGGVGTDQLVGAGRDPAACLRATGGGLIAYDRFDSNPPIVNWRAEVRLVGLRSDGAPCGVPGDCLSSFCATGSCCPVPCLLGDCSTGICIGEPPDAAVPGEDAATPPGLDASVPGEDAALSGEDAATAGEDAAVAGEDAAVVATEDTGVPSPADAASEPDASVVEADASSAGKSDSGPADAARLSGKFSFEAGCACSTTTASPLWLALLGLVAPWRRRRRLP